MIPPLRQVRGERAVRRSDLDDITHPHFVDQPPGDRTTRHLPNADPGRGPDRGTDRVRATHLAAADGEALPRGEGELGREALGHPQGDRGRVVGQLFDPLDHQWVEVPSQNGFTASNGSRQEAHQYNDLHAVAPNSAVRSVSRAPHRGHATAGGWACNVRGTGAAGRSAGAGGAMPARRSFSRPVSVIQSVVHGGANCMRTTTSAPSRLARSRDLQVGDLLHRRTTAEGRGDRDDNRAVDLLDRAQDPQIGDGQER